MMTRAENVVPSAVLAHMRTTASHTIAVGHLQELLREVPGDAPAEQYRTAVVEENILGRPTQAGRLRTFRHLRELYLFDPAHAPFIALRRLWDVDVDAQPLIAGILAVARDEVFRASWPGISRALPGSVVTSDDLANVIAESYAGSLSAATIGKIGRNTGACWTQTGHLAGRTRKVRTAVAARPAAIAFAAYLGHLDGGRAVHVLDNAWSSLLGLNGVEQLGALRRAHDAGLLDLKVAGHVVEVGFSFIEGGAR
jgi:hypothetical protein